jgi:hypothetical protein
MAITQKVGNRGLDNGKCNSFGISFSMVSEMEQINFSSLTKSIPKNDFDLL